MDQPFESDAMEVTAEIPISSADEAFDGYEGMDEEGFEAENAFVDEMDEFASSSTNSFDEYAFEDNLEGDLWDDYAELEAGDEFKEHRTDQRESNRGRHEKGQRRRGIDQSGEAGDGRRRPSRRRPPGHRGAWPPRQNSFSEEFFGDSMEAFSDELIDDYSFAADFYEDNPVAARGVNALAAMEEEIADALEAEDSNEFLRRAVRGIRKAASVARVGRGVGQVAHVVAPVASAIPLPQAQAIAQIANIAGRLLADGADEFEALEEFLTFAETEDAINAAMPVIAGLTVRSRMTRASQLPRPVRRQLIRSISRSGRALAQRRGQRSIHAIPPVVQAVQRTAMRRRLPVRELPQAIQRTTARLVTNPRLVNRLLVSTGSTTVATNQCRCGACRGATQRLILNGPVEILIRNR